jgi:hypothetical protein
MNSTGQALADPTTNPPPQAAPQPGPDDTGGTPDDLGSQWSQWVGKPANRAALMQFGIAMLQPVQQGETGTSHFANAIGSGGEAASDVNKQAIAKEAADSSQQLKAEQAELAGVKASVQPELAQAASDRAGAYAGAAEARVQNAGLRNQMQEQQNRTIDSIKLSNAYQTYVSQTAKTNADPMNENPQPIMDFETWQQSNGIKPPAGTEANAPMPPGQGTKPPLNQLVQKNPQAWAQIKQLYQAGDPRGAKAIDQLRNSVSDPQMVDSLLKGP